MNHWAKECARALLARNWDDELHRRLGLEALLQAKSDLGVNGLESEGISEEIVEESFILDFLSGSSESHRLVKESLIANRKK